MQVLPAERALTQRAYPRCSFVLPVLIASASQARCSRNRRALSLQIEPQ
jgi:hypothetical protein